MINVFDDNYWVHHAYKYEATIITNYHSTEIVKEDSWVYQCSNMMVSKLETWVHYYKQVNHFYELDLI